MRTREMSVIGDFAKRRKGKKPTFGLEVKGAGLVKNKVGAEFTACVGQLTTHTAISDVPIRAVYWHVQGEALKSYNLSARDISLPIYLTAPDLQNNPLSFYWIEGGTYTVSVDILTDYGWGKVQHTFDVTSPRVDLFSSDTGFVSVVTYDVDRRAIAFVDQGGEIKQGISMQLRVEGRQNLYGQIATIQLVKTARRDLLPSGKSEYFSTNGQWVLDNGRNPGSYIYSSPVPLNPGGVATLSPTDGPLQEVAYPPITQMDIAKEEYKMYIMFKPDGAGSIWVPLNMLPWFWQGTATYSYKDWHLSNAGNSQDPAGGAIDSPPGWVLNVADGHWITE